MIQQQCELGWQWVAGPSPPIREITMYPEVAKQFFKDVWSKTKKCHDVYNDACGDLERKCFKGRTLTEIQDDWFIEEEDDNE
jgi:hypothetical protein